MTRPTPPSARARLLGAAAATLIGLAATVVSLAPAQAERGTTATGPASRGPAGIVTPGDFTGYGFDQCLAPTQKAMNTWLRSSPFLSVGIYISGDSRACRSQPNLTPEWIRTQLTKGWRLLPITLGPQASCSTRFPRYGTDETIKPRPGSSGTYKQARAQGRAEADSAVAAAKALGIVAGSTLWYDLEGFDHTRRNCRESALSFLSAWTDRIHALDYVSGVYSSAGSGIKVLDDARVNRPGKYTMPDMIWLARWDGVANTSSSYIRDDGWRPGGRVKQYQGGHDETWGGVRINIDRNFLDVGRGSVAAPETHCKGLPVDLADYRPLKPGTVATDRVKILQCFLSEAGVYSGKVNGAYSEATLAAVHAWQEKKDLVVSDQWSREAWMTLLAWGPRKIVKFGSAGPEVRRVQRALNASDRQVRLSVDGVFAAETQQALRAYQHAVGLTTSGVADPKTWQALRQGLR